MAELKLHVVEVQMWDTFRMWGSLKLRPFPSPPPTVADLFGPASKPSPAQSMPCRRQTSFLPSSADIHSHLPVGQLADQLVTVSWSMELGLVPVLKSSPSRGKGKKNGKGGEMQVNDWKQGVKIEQSLLFYTFYIVCCIYFFSSGQKRSWREINQMDEGSHHLPLGKNRAIYGCKVPELQYSQSLNDCFNQRQQNAYVDEEPPCFLWEKAQCWTGLRDLRDAYVAQDRLKRNVQA